MGDSDLVLAVFTQIYIYIYNVPSLYLERSPIYLWTDKTEGTNAYCSHALNYNVAFSVYYFQCQMIASPSFMFCFVSVVRKQCFGAPLNCGRFMHCVSQNDASAFWPVLLFSVIIILSCVKHVP